MKDESIAEFSQTAILEFRDDLKSIWPRTGMKLRHYRPVADNDYIEDHTVGAMMGPEAIRKAQQWALLDGVGIFHIHTHGRRGIPRFSGVDLRESPKFVPNFSSVAPQSVHGAIVLSDDAATGIYWPTRHDQPHPISSFSEVGAPLRRWETR